MPEIVLSPSPVGLGTSLRLLDAIAPFTRTPPRTTLIVTPPGLMDQWARQIGKLHEFAHILSHVRPGVFIGRNRDWFSMPVKALWNKPRKEFDDPEGHPYFFITTFMRVSELSGVPDGWFDVTIEDEAFHYKSRQLPRDLIRRLGRQFIRIDEENTVQPKVRRFHICDPTH